ncbi:MAG TPA: hypothetical protein VMT80_02075 [Candidatus Paceibacterota bacterium]|nr:hypothetical protein [Candidatus Paceibacterota bacterium]
MYYLYAVAASLVLCAGFLALTAYERRRGARVFARARDAFDRRVEHAAFLFSHVDFAAFLREESLRLLHKASHDIAHVSLIAVRAVERGLTRLVRNLRTRRASERLAPRETSREFVRTLSDFKGHLEATRPEMPDVR